MGATGRLSEAPVKSYPIQKPVSRYCDTIKYQLLQYKNDDLLQQNCINDLEEVQGSTQGSPFLHHLTCSSNNWNEI